MSMGIYYDAKRRIPLSGEEEEKIDKITRKYIEEYPRKEEYEGPDTFDDKELGIYCGMLRIPLKFYPEEMEEFLDYWLKWLTDVTYVLPEAEWNVCFEDVPLIWDEDDGWRLMSDEEFEKKGLI